MEEACLSYNFQVFYGSFIGKTIKHEKLNETFKTSWNYVQIPVQLGGFYKGYSITNNEGKGLESIRSYCAESSTFDELTTQNVDSKTNNFSTDTLGTFKKASKDLFDSISAFMPNKTELHGFLSRHMPKVHLYQGKSLKHQWKQLTKIHEN